MHPTFMKYWQLQSKTEKMINCITQKFIWMPIFGRNSTLNLIMIQRFSKICTDRQVCSKIRVKSFHNFRRFFIFSYFLPRFEFSSAADVRLEHNEATGEYFVRNVLSDNVPSLIHGNGLSKDLLNNFGSYVAGAFKHNECQLCKEFQIELPKGAENLPKVTIAISIPLATPFLEEFFDSILALEYPKEKLNVFIYNNVLYHDEVVQAFIETHGKSYANVKHVKHTDSYKEPIARNLAV